MRKRIGSVGRSRSSIDELVGEIFADVEDKNGLINDIKKYSEIDVLDLPAFNEDGSVVLYECGGILLGKSALVRFLERIG